MGGLCVGHADRAVLEDPPQTFTGDEWEKTFPPMTRSELQKKRDEFWDTRVEGSAEIWQAIRMSSECEDEKTGRSILESAGVTPYTIDKAESCFCYDERGHRYDIPMFVLRLPKNLKSTSQEDPTQDLEKAIVPKPESEKKAKLSEAKESKDDEGVEHVELPGAISDEKEKEKIKVKVRLSTAEDLEVTLPAHLTFLDLKNIIASKKNILVDQQRIFLNGHALPDKDLIKAHVKSGIFLQIFILPLEK